MAPNGCEINLTNNPNNCGACGNVCGLTAHTTSTNCTNSACTVTGCATGFYNQNGTYPDGCVCAASGTTNTCGGVALAVPGTASGTILPEPPATTQQWYTVTFPSEAGKCGLHYTISLNNNANPIAMTVFTNCTGSGVTCGGGEPTTGYQTWTWSNSGTTGNPQCTDTYPTVFYVEVFGTGAATTCMNYTLTTSVQ